MRRVRELWALHDEYNARYFGGKLFSINILIKRNRTKDGWYDYAGRGDWKPIRERLHKATITISEGCWKEDTVEAALLHEMVHQYQCEVLDVAPDHDNLFKSFCRSIERRENVGIIR